MDRKRVTKDFIKLKKQLEDRDFLISSILFSVAPTLANKKQASLMSLTKANRNLYRLWEKYKNDLFEGSNIKFFELRNYNDSALVLFYNPKKLGAIFKDEKTLEFIEQYGYSRHMSIEEGLKQLSTKFIQGCPHEIGIFLGYPLEDVKGFILNMGKNCLMCRYWKVYKNPERAIACFDAYDQAKINVIRELTRGRKPWELLKTVNF